MGADLGVVRVPLGQVVAAGTGLVVRLRLGSDGEILGEEPIHVRRVRLVGDDVLKCPMAVAAMVENPVEDDPHPSAVAGIQQLPERREIAEPVVDPEVVDRVIAMVGAGLEDRREVQRVDPEALDVVEVVDDSLQVAAEEVVACRRGVPGFGIRWRERRVAAREPLRKDLVEDGVFQPFGCSHRGQSFSPVVAIPRTRARWQNRKTTMLGTVAVSVPAMR